MPHNSIFLSNSADQSQAKNLPSKTACTIKPAPNLFAKKVVELFAKQLLWLNCLKCSKSQSWD